MRRIFRYMWLLLTVGCMLLCACGEACGDELTTGPLFETVVGPEGEGTQTPETQTPETQTPETQIPETQILETQIPETQVSETEMPETETAASKPEHSELYLDGYTVDQVVEYFNEVVLNTEYSGGGNYQVVQKWVEPIIYRIYGEATREDMAVLTNLFDQLNEIHGFPGIRPQAEAHELVNLRINFYNREDFYANMREIVGPGEADGAVQYWYSDLNDIYDARIGCRTDVDQSIRNSVLPEEVVNGLGITDTELREDSITYQWSSFNLEPSEMDWLIIKLLYHPEMKPGMNREECRAVIEKLYY